MREELHEDIGALREELHEDIGALREELHEQIGELRTEVRANYRDLRDRIGESSCEEIWLGQPLAGYSGGRLGADPLTSRTRTLTL